ncbi:MAG: pyruvate kinase [Rhabdochlamydiaceae bacterium]|nr:pyruvate kinase [Rhabdochlamydiaceae bacterium]
MTRTKMVCTMGPQVSSPEMILKLIDAGMNVARINFSHGTHVEHAKVIATLKKAREDRNIPLAIMVDTKGPEIRLGEISGSGLSLKAGDVIPLVRKVSSPEQILLTPPEVFESFKAGQTLLFDDGYIQGKVIKITPAGADVEILNTGLLKSHKNVTLPEAQVKLPALTDQDVKDLTFACEQGIDWVAASFIRSAEHVHEIQKLLKSAGKPDILVMAKIESAEGVENFDAILEAADGVMVARGDLGVELPIEEVPPLQKMMIRRCVEVSKPVVTATQMLESMIQNPRPTRAEVSDVANAIYDSSSAVMLSGETAVGKYPIETVAMMRRVISETELDFSYRDFYDQHVSLEFSNVAASLSSAAVQTAYTAEAKAIFVFTISGATARLISRFRPEMPIIALTPNEKTYHQLALEWGVIPLKAGSSLTLSEAIAFTSEYALERRLIKKGDLVVMTTGTPFWNKGTTNTLIVDRV